MGPIFSYFCPTPGEFSCETEQPLRRALTAGRSLFGSRCDFRKSHPIPYSNYSYSPLPVLGKLWPDWCIIWIYIYIQCQPQKKLRPCIFYSHLNLELCNDLIRTWKIVLTMLNSPTVWSQICAFIPSTSWMRWSYLFRTCGDSTIQK